MPIKYFIGFDPGQGVDPSSVCIVEKQPAREGEPILRMRGLKRYPLRTPYPDIVASLRGLCRREPLRGNYELVVDYTGVGRAVVDMLRRADLRVVPVTITGGVKVIYEDGDYRVPKRELVGQLDARIQNRTIVITKRHPEAQELVNELLHFDRKVDPKTAHDSYACWREGVHDDLVLAAGLACWYASRPSGFGVIFA